MCYSLSMIIFWWIWTIGLLGALCFLFREVKKSIWKDVLIIVMIVGIRMSIMPIERHSFEGHEAEYIRYFMQERLPGEGDTASYPAMQIWWWLWGNIFSSFPKMPIWISSVFGAGSIILLVQALMKIFRQTTHGIVWLSWLVCLPIHWVWSLSAYNVIFPFFWVSLAFWFLVHNRPSWTIAVSLAMATANRMEIILVVIPFFYWIWNQRGWRWSYVLMLLFPVISMVSMLPTSIPGEGERWLAFSINWQLIAYHDPYHLLLPLLLFGGWKGKEEHLHWMLGAGGLLIGNHLVMASFDDYASRHTLVAILAIAILLGPLFNSKLGRGIMWAVILLHTKQVLDVQERWYAEPEQFGKAMQEAYPELPVKTLNEAQKEQCAWINEENVFAGQPVRSHFNLLDPLEVEELRKEHSCIDWCLSLQDWRWSSLGVRDRAYRIMELYELEEKALVQEEEQVCLQFRVGKRQLAIN